MSVPVAAFAHELTKLAEAEKNKKPSYLKGVAAGLPVIGVQALADIPEGILESSATESIRHGVPQLVTHLGPVRAVSRVGAGMWTTPIFMSGLRDIQSAKTPEDKRRGMAKIVAAGGLYSGLRGGIEAGLDRAATTPLRQRLLSIAGPKAAMGIGGAALTGLSIGKSLQEGGKPKTFTDKYVKPVAVGSGLAAGRGVIEELGSKGLKTLETEGGRRGVFARASGKAMAGAAGTLVLSQLMHKFLGEKHEKHAEFQNPTLGPSPTQMNSEAKSWAQAASTEDLLSFYKVLETRGGERSPSARSVFYPLHDELTARGAQLPPLTTRMDVTSPAHGPSIVDMGILLGVAAAPALSWKALNALPPTDRDRTLTDALDRMYLQGQIEKRMGEKGQGASSPEHGFIEISRDADPSELAHEIGHVRRGTLRAATIGSDLVQHAGMVGRVASIALPLYVVGSAGDNSFSTRSDLQSKAKALIALGLISGAAQSPQIAEEAVASLKGLHYLSEAGATGNELVEKALRLSPALASYALPVALPFLGAHMLRRKAKTAKT